MVKRQREKQYNSAREQRELSSLRTNTGSTTAVSASGTAIGAGTVQRRLPFSHCALTLLPFETPVCLRIRNENEDSSSQLPFGILFEASAIYDHVLKYKNDPVTGAAPLGIQDLIVLEGMEQDPETQQWQCPILQKALGDHTKIVAVIQQDPDAAAAASSASLKAHAYSFEAYHELNVKAKNFTDLISGFPFDAKRDVILLNDPHNDAFQRRRDINSFSHVLQARRSKQQTDSNSNTATNNDVRHSKTATRVLEQIAKNKQQQQQDKQQKQKAENDESENINKRHRTSNNDDENTTILASDVTGISYTTAQASSSLTSTFASVPTTSQNVARLATAEEILKAQLAVMRSLKQKAHVKLHLQIGGGSAPSPRLVTVILQLHCDIVPRTCANFLGLCEQGAYDGSSFYRLIPNFMIQGGSSTSNKTVVAAADKEEETSFWGPAFRDEFDDRLKHSQRGVVSMANAGKQHDNKRQFFITFRETTHLDRKHSIFGVVVGDGDGGKDDDVLSQLEKIPVNKKNDKPLQEIKIIQTEIMGGDAKNPWKMAQRLEKERIDKLILARTRNQQKEQQKKQKQQPQSTADSSSITSAAAVEPGVGRYLQDRLKKTAAAASTVAPVKKQQQQQQQPMTAMSTNINSDGEYDQDATATTGPSSIFPSRLKAPPPQKTVFKDFSGW